MSNGESGEESGVGFGGALGPFLVAGEEVIENGLCDAPVLVIALTLIPAITTWTE